MFLSGSPLWIGSFPRRRRPPGPFGGFCRVRFNFFVLLAVASDIVPNLFNDMGLCRFLFVLSCLFHQRAFGHPMVTLVAHPTWSRGFPSGDLIGCRGLAFPWSP